jgi:hypothetical protein
VFRQVTITGQGATLVWCGQTAAVLGRWSIAKDPKKGWQLQAALTRADRYCVRQRGLLFSAPRLGGFFCWPVLELVLTPGTVRATLGPIEH